MASPKLMLVKWAGLLYLGKYEISPIDVAGLRYLLPLAALAQLTKTAQGPVSDRRRLPRLHKSDAVFDQQPRPAGECFF